MTERIRNHSEALELPYGEISGERSGRLVLECDCRARLVLEGEVVARHPDRLHPGCGVCGEGWRQEEVRIPEEKRCYSWLEDFLEQLEGKEESHEYYTQL